uniref:uncharacterized protein LOC120327251 n=1 Tax=Styela clava TaxID=7725 RepID=UPI001939D6EC|nr:uncharacterized protein LOC120327251 [Styela clava]
MDELDYYLRVVIGKDAGLIFLCVFGAVLNSVMLYMLLSKKQIRSSVHTVYMVQIALTDLLVCAVWLVLTSVIIHNLLLETRDSPSYEPNHTEEVETNESSEYATITEDPQAGPIQYRTWRIMYTWYNFHYYTNIFLLASMSVERCAAVWKSMRCQRYQYNRKIIIGVSILMWILAFVFVLPNLIDPDLMVSDSDSPSSVSRTIKSEEIPSVSPQEWDEKTSDALQQVFRDRALKHNELIGVPRSGKIKVDEIGTDPLERPFDAEVKIYKADLETLYECYTLMLHAYNNNRDYVRDHGAITIEGCLTSIVGIMHAYSAEFRNASANRGDDGPILDYSTDYYQPFNDLYENYGTDPYDEMGNREPPLIPGDDSMIKPEIYNNETGVLEAVEKHFYQELLADAVKTLLEHHHNASQNEACDPNLSDAARVYVLVVNLVLGFFVPFSIIVFSYVSIAYMIGKRARSRMNPGISETSTTHFAHNYLQNQSTTNIPLGPINMREKHSRTRRDSMGRRMSDFMRYVVLRKPQGGADNRTYWTESDRGETPSGSMHKSPYSASSRPYEDSSSANGKSDGFSPSGKLSAKTPEETKSSSSSPEDDPLYDEELQEAIRQLRSVQMRGTAGNDTNTKVNPRIKKYSFCFDATNENIPQTIEEHPYEMEENDDDESFLTTSNRSSANEVLQSGATNHASLLLMQRNPRRESGGSYGSSMDSMATDQTSLHTSLHDKRYSAATTMSALTPPTPIEPSNPNANAFFPPDEKLPYNRSQSAESGYPLLGDRTDGHHSGDQRSPRPNKPGSQLNDIKLKLYRNSLRKQGDDTDIGALLSKENDGHSSPDISKTDQASTSSTVTKPTARERYSYPRMTRSKSAPGDHIHSVKHGKRSGDDHGQSSISQYPKYHRQNSSTSTVYFQRGRTYSTTSRGSVGGTSILHKTMARKNAERHLRVSRTVLAYVIVFAICWLPQRITYLLYVIEALMGATDDICIKLISGTRLLSFISVLLNPAVYIMTQRDIRAYIRNSYCVTKLRHWYTKCTRKRHVRAEYNTARSRDNEETTDRKHDIELQIRHDQEIEKELSSNRQTNVARPNFRVASPQRMSSPQRPAIHARKNQSGTTHETFAPTTAILRRGATTIDEMKEEEEAAEESLEKEMKRIAAEEENCRKDDINKNWLESSEDDIISAKNTSGSGNKTSSSSSKSENFEEFWMRWLKSGGAELLSPANGNLSSTDTPSRIDPSLAELDDIVQTKIPNGTNNEISETMILK